MKGRRGLSLTRVIITDAAGSHGTATPGAPRLCRPPIRGRSLGSSMPSRERRTARVILLLLLFAILLSSWPSPPDPAFAAAEAGRGPAAAPGTARAPSPTPPA